MPTVIARSFPRSLSLPFFVALVLFAGGASAQPRALSEADAIAIGLENSKVLHTSQEKLNQADARWSEVNAARLPSLKFSGGYTRLSSVPAFTFTIPGFPPQTISPVILDTYSAQLTLQQPVFTGWRLESGSAMARATTEAARADLEKDRRDLIYTIRSAYWSYYKAQQVLAVVDSTVAQTAAHLQDAQNFLAQGMATTNDVLKVQVQLSAVKLQRIDADNAVTLARLALNNAIGLPLETPITLTSAPVLQQQAFAPTEALVHDALQDRSDLRAMRYRVEAGEEGVTNARAGWMPNVFLVGTYTYARPNARIFPTRDQFDGTWAAGVQATWDLWTWGTAGAQTAQAEAQVAQTRDALGLMRDGATLEVTSDALLVARSRDRIALADETVKQAEENLRVTNDKYKAGLVLNSEVLDAEVALEQARVNSTQAVVDFALAQAALEKAVGK